MIISKDQIQQFNRADQTNHQRQFAFLQEQLHQTNIDADSIIQKLQEFTIAIPSWALGAGGTRFGRFSYGGEPANLEEKISDVGVINALTQSAGAISLHIPWDIPGDPEVIRKLAIQEGLTFDAMNSNTFQDQSQGQQAHSYKFGSLCHTDRVVREQAIDHNKQVIDIGVSLGSKSLTRLVSGWVFIPRTARFSESACTYD